MRVRLTDRISYTARLDRIAAEVELMDPRLALAIDMISDQLECRESSYNVYACIVNAGLKEWWDKLTEKVKSGLGKVMSQFQIVWEDMPKSKAEALKILDEAFVANPPKELLNLSKNPQKASELMTKEAIDKKVIIGAIVFLLVTGALGLLINHVGIQEFISLIMKGDIKSILAQLLHSVIELASHRVPGTDSMKNPVMNFIYDNFPRLNAWLGEHVYMR
jgi:hypothetical protein